MELHELLFRAALTFSLGLIIGFQREKKETTLAGIRTFPIIAFIGFFCALLEKNGSSWALAAGILGVMGIVASGAFHRPGPHNSGLTTEFAVLLVFILGAGFVLLERVEVVVVVGGVCALLLFLKETMHGVVEAMNRTDVKAIMQFVLLAFVILPILPDATYDAYGVLNPRKIWLMVVLITGISLVSYLIQKLRKGDDSILWTGVLGGLISSTAATVTLSRLSAKLPHRRSLVPALVIASTVAFVRVLSEVLIVSPNTFSHVALPLAGLFLFMLILSAVIYLRARKEDTHEDISNHSTPSEVRAALIFGLLFAVILYASAWAKDRYGESGLFVVSFVSGLIDVDAITLSTTQLIQSQKINATTGWKLIMLAFISNLVFKSVLVASIARGMVRTHACLYLLISAAVGGAIIIFF